ncbi:MAG: sensor histidine kinase [Holdemanella porci]
MKTELISNVSHDLKTPLTCIKNYLTLLKNDDITLENKHHYLEQLTLYTNRLKNLIEDLFEISKVDSGNINLNLQRVRYCFITESSLSRK